MDRSTRIVHHYITQVPKNPVCTELTAEVVKVSRRSVEGLILYEFWNFLKHEYT